MNKPNENEQWLLYGDCGICRRKNYCKKDCKKRKKRIVKREAWIKDVVETAMNKATGGMYGEMLNKTKY